MLHKNPACLNGHWAVQVNGEGLHFLLAKQNGEVIQNLLRTSDRERWHQHLSIIPRYLLDDLLKLGNGFGVGSMVAVAIGGLQENHISPLEQVKFTNNWQRLWTQVAGKY